jgi:hypothetical protein
MLNDPQSNSAQGMLISGGDGGVTGTQQTASQSPAMAGLHSEFWASILGRLLAAAQS